MARDPQEVPLISGHTKYVLMAIFYAATRDDDWRPFMQRLAVPEAARAEVDRDLLELFEFFSNLPVKEDYPFFQPTPRRERS